MSWPRSSRAAWKRSTVLVSATGEWPAAPLAPALSTGAATRSGHPVTRRAARLPEGCPGLPLQQHRTSGIPGKVHLDSPQTVEQIRDCRGGRGNGCQSRKPLPTKESSDCAPRTTVHALDHNRPTPRVQRRGQVEGQDLERTQPVAASTTTGGGRRRYLCHVRTSGSGAIAGAGCPVPAAALPETAGRVPPVKGGVAERSGPLRGGEPAV